MKKTISILFVLVVLASIFWVAFKSNPVPQTDEPIIVGINHLPDFNAQEYYHLSQGSEIYPFKWAMALIDKDTNKPFMEGLSRFGFLPDYHSKMNPYGLPVGLTVAKPKGIKIRMLGINCAACHTTDLHYNNQIIRIDGSTSMFDIRQFYSAIADSSEATLKDPKKLWKFFIKVISPLNIQEPKQTSLPNKLARFVVNEAITEIHSLEKLEQKSERCQKLANSIKNLCAKFQPTELEKSLSHHTGITHGEEIFSGITAKGVEAHHDQILTKLREIYNFLIARIKHIRKLKAQQKTDTIWGYGRIDAFGTVRNVLFDQVNHRPAHAPVSIPSLWGLNKKRWLHSTANTNSVIERNIAQALGVGSIFVPDSFATTVNIPNQFRLEELTYLIVAPQWPTKILGEPDRVKVKRGQKIYGETCVKCHDQGIQRKNGLIDFQQFSLASIGTDPNAAINFDQPVLKSDGSVKEKFPAALSHLLANIKSKAFASMTSKDQQKFAGLEEKRLPVVWRNAILTDQENAAYPVRSLEGIWSTAPFLHNGSVPTIYHLLLPVAKRPKNFLVGQLDYDPVNLGLQIDKNKIKQQNKTLYMFEISKPGNSNSGHEGKIYGTELSHEERMDLIEYLKVYKDSPTD